jgi:lysophospholipase L1-like esterase
MDKKKIIKVTIATFVILGIMLLCGKHYMYTHGLSGEYVNEKVKDGQIKVACIGDSITYGQGVEDWEKNNYPAQLQELLGDAYHVANFGSAGACLNPNGDQPYVNREIYQESLEYDADILVVMLGTNDAKAQNWVSADDFVMEYLSFLHNYYTEENPPKVYIALCAEAYYTEDADKSTGVAGFDVQPAIIDEIASSLAEGLPACDCALTVNGIIDIHSLTEAHPEWFEADGIHPNADGAKAIAELVADAIR